ncbi:MAG: AAA family ATPase [Anaerolineae bacterium]|nr:KAP family NTPase [Candidatus Roseilinea sp.]MDW8449087.1 AAA family ATPase [Anaerolineae bacterium]
MREPIMARQRRLLRQWGLSKFPPFADVPPKDDPERLATLFTGRDDELDLATQPLMRGENVLVRGAWGVGKTTFILQLLHALVGEAQAVKERLLPIYIDNFRGGTLQEFHRLLLFALATALADKDDDARAIAEAMKGISISHNRSRSIKGSIEINLFTFGTAGGEIGLESVAERRIGLDSPEYWIDELLRRGHKRYEHIVVAIDDLDKTDPRPNEFLKVRTLFDQALPILRDQRCAFILTGRTLTVAQDIYGSILGLFNRQIALDPLPPEDLRAIAVKTLNLVRHQARPDAHPFSDEAIARLAASSYVPRHFNRNCADVLDAAVRLDRDRLDGAAFDECFVEAQAKVAAEVEPQIRQLLYIARKYGGISQQNRRALDELGLGDFIEILPVLDYLVQRDLLVRENTIGGLRFIVSSRAERAALPPTDVSVES